MPQPVLFIALGVFGGLMLGFGMAYLLESQDDTLTDAFQVETVSNLPVLGMIPFHRMEARPREGALATESSSFLVAPEGSTAESFRSLRSGLVQMCIRDRRRCSRPEPAPGGCRRRKRDWYRPRRRECAG